MNNNFFTKNKIWDLNELKYSDKLYHYTDVKGANGIFGHVDSPNLPQNCVSLRFMRIDCMKKNDTKEREHIDCAIKKIAQKLLKYNIINNDFAQIVADYKPTYKGYYTFATDEIDFEFHQPQNQWRIDFGPVDYYVACFSVKPNNEHIIKEFKSSVCITFNTEFLQRYTDPFAFCFKKTGTWASVVDVSRNLYPLKSIHECYCNTFLRFVEYVDTSACVYKIRSTLLENRLTNIYKNYIKNNEKDLKKVQNDIEDMYSLCDAFVKDIKYEPEKEVRFVIRLPQREYFVEKYGLFPKVFADNHFLFAEDRTYLQLPISEDYITL